jgi:hypothetical protein
MKRALLIASSEFSPDSGIEPLRFPVNDVDAMETVLRAEDFGFEVNKLLNESHSIVQERLNEWFAKANYDDFLLIYFSGHGLLSQSRELFLTCANTRVTRLHSTGLKYSYLTDLVREYGSQTVAIFLDCCYAGRAIVGARTQTKGAIEAQVAAAVTEPGYGIFFLGASGKNQIAEEREVDGHGRFTQQIIVGLSSGDADIDGDGSITANELATFVKRKLRSLSADQEPIEGGAYQGEMVLGNNRRKKLQLTLKAIGDHIERTKGVFRRETFRKIEDYLEELSGREGDLKEILADPRYIALSRYAVEGAKLEEVVAVFLVPTAFSVRHDAPYGVVSNISAERKDPTASQMDVSSELISETEKRGSEVPKPIPEVPAGASEPSKAGPKAVKHTPYSTSVALSLAGASGAVIGYAASLPLGAFVIPSTTIEFASVAVILFAAVGAIGGQLRKHISQTETQAITLPMLLAALWLGTLIDTNHSHAILPAIVSSLFGVIGIRVALQLAGKWTSKSRGGEKGPIAIWKAELIKHRGWWFIIRVRSGNETHRIEYIRGFIYGQLCLDGDTMRRFWSTGQHRHSFMIVPYTNKFQIVYKFGSNGISDIILSVDEDVILSSE